MLLIEIILVKMVKILLPVITIVELTKEVVIVLITTQIIIVLTKII